MKFYRLNHQIKAPTLRVISNGGEQTAILTLEEALKKAGAENLDLVEIAPNVNPPVAKIIDYKKFRYEESKKDRGSKKKDSSLKELWLSPRIAEHDLIVRIKRAEEFLENSQKVKFTVKFKGREMAHPENGHSVLKKVLDHFGEKIAVEREAKFEGRNLSVIIAKVRGAKNAQTENT